MPKSKNPEAYPLEYAELIRRIDAGQRVTLHFPDKKSAESQRFDIYGYRTALATAQHELQYKAARLIARVVINLGGGYDLLLSSQMDEPIAVQLRGAFAQLGDITGGDIGTEEYIPELVPAGEAAGDAGEAALAKFGYGTEFNQGGTQEQEPAAVAPVVPVVPTAVTAPATPMHRTDGWRAMKGYPPYGMNPELDAELDAEHDKEKD